MMFKVNQSKSGMYYFILTDESGGRLMSGEMVRTKDSVLKTIESVRTNAPIAEIEDQTK